MRSWALWLLWFVTAKAHVHKVAKGADFSIMCWKDNSPNVTRRVFCKNDCEEENILVQTSGSNNTSGRYSIKHETKGSPPQDFIVVGISNLTLNDSGRYRCFWDQLDQYADFMVEVTDGVRAGTVVSVTAGEDFRHSCSFINPDKKKTFCRNACSEEDILVATTGYKGQSGRYKIEVESYGEHMSEVTVKIRNVSHADSGAYQCLLDSATKKVWINVSPVPGVESESKDVFSVTAGNDFSHSFFFYPDPKKMTFCRNTCSEEDVLVATTSDEEQRGRYEIQLEPHGEHESHVMVTIRNMTVADSGAYQCRLDNKSKEIWISVAPGESPKTLNLTMILILVPVCVAFVATAAALTICCKRRTRTGRGTGRGTGGGRRQLPEKEKQRVCPESENIYEDLCLADMEPIYCQL